MSRKMPQKPSELNKQPHSAILGSNKLLRTIDIDNESWLHSEQIE